MQKMIRFCHLLHLRSRVGDGYEVTADLYRAHCLLRALEKILFENVRFRRAAGFAGDNKKCRRNVDLMLERFHLSRIGGVEHVEGRKVRNPAEGHAQHFRTKTGPAHAQQQYVLEAAILNLFRNLLELIVLGSLFFDDIEPPQPLVFVAACPQGSVALPQTLHVAARLPLRNRAFYRRSQRFRQ